MMEVYWPRLETAQRNISPAVSDKNLFLARCQRKH